jgi:hypothetical protein
MLKKQMRWRLAISLGSKASVCFFSSAQLFILLSYFSHNHILSHPMMEME